MPDLLQSRKMCGCSKIIAQTMADSDSTAATFWIVAAGGLGVGDDPLDTVEILELKDQDTINFENNWSVLGRLQTPRYHFPTVGVLPNQGLLIQIISIIK